MEHLGKRKPIVPSVYEVYDPISTLLEPARVFKMCIRCGMGTYDEMGQFYLMVVLGIAGH